MWLKGPHFLQGTDIPAYVKGTEVKLTVDESDPEIKICKALATVTTSPSVIIQEDISERFERFSNWDALRRTMTTLRNMAAKKTFKKMEQSVSQINETELWMFKLVQEEHYSSEIESLKGAEPIRKESSLIRLNPYLDDKGLIRVGGRLDRATMLTQLEKHPIIIPKSTHIAQLLAKHHHSRIHHLGRRSTLAALREAGLWLVSATGIVKNVLAQCTTCKKLRKPAEEQLMGQHPPERLEKTPPFTHVGMDVFGHFLVKDRRTELKRWGLLFTCLYSRAVHVEMLEDLTTDSFICALRCFVAIRGPVRTLFSDQGTNFIGAMNEFERLIELTKDKEVKAHLLENKIEFRLNSPAASHQGGAWERLIRSIRVVLSGMASKYGGRLSTQTLRTAFYEAAAVVNSRPLTASEINDPEETIITPNCLLTMKTEPLTALPPGVFQDDELYGRMRWRAVQQFAQEFWQEWKSEYLRYLTQRQKWTKKSENVKVGDVVILKDDDLPRNVWKVGIVETTEKGVDGMVRNVSLRVGNRRLDTKGRPMVPATLLKRPVQKVIVLVAAEC